MTPTGAISHLHLASCNVCRHSTSRLSHDTLLLLAFASLAKRRTLGRGVHSSSLPKIHRHQARRNDGLLANQRGVYEDLGTLQEYDGYNIENVASSNNVHKQVPEEEIREWRAKHWVVLIDDESSIRLAIGDYLHSMGYKVITACDGPLSFLEMLLWTCGWSFLDSDESNVFGDNTECPPWLEDVVNGSEERPWRLPSIIISDIRMPGGIDGVQLLELLKEERSAKAAVATSKQKKRRRRKKNKIVNKVDGITKTPDPGILAGWVEFATPIATPIDQAKKILDAIYNTLQYCQSKSSHSSSQNYPHRIQDVPVILLTAKAMISDRIKGYKAGADGYLPKPFRPEELLCMVDNLMKRQDRERSVQLMYSHGTGRADNLSGNDRMLSLEEIEAMTSELSEIKEILQLVAQRE